MQPIDPARASARVLETIIDAARTETAVVVNSPPGAGKSTLVREAARRIGASLGQIPIVVQTNEQADDMVDGFLAELDAGIGTGLQVGRLHKAGYVLSPRIAADPRVTAATDVDHLAVCDVVVGTAAKWGLVTDRSWQFGIVDEAYQMRSDGLLPIGAMMDRLLLVGDPGQLAPFTNADASHLRGIPLSPLQTAAATVLLTQPAAVCITLPVSWRLPSSAVGVLGPSFYEQPFIAGYGHDVRRLQMPIAPVNTVAQGAVHQAAGTGWAFVEMRDLIMPTSDPAAVALLADIVRQLFRNDVTVLDERGQHTLSARRVAVGVTHRDQRAAVRMAVDDVCAELGFQPGAIVVDTANRLQGREFDVVVAWHPLSGRRDATAFHLDAGRLCVLLSRHRQACIVVSRGGLRAQLMAHASTDPVWIGEHVPVVDGWSAHLSVLDHLEDHRLIA